MLVFLPFIILILAMVIYLLLYSTTRPAWLSPTWPAWILLLIASISITSILLFDLKILGEGIIKEIVLITIGLSALMGFPSLVLRRHLKDQIKRGDRPSFWNALCFSIPELACAGIVIAILTMTWILIIISRSASWHTG